MGGLRGVGEANEGGLSKGAGGTFRSLTCLTQPPITTYWIATTQRYLTAKGIGKEG